MLERFSVFLRQVAIGLRTLSSRTPLDELHLTGELGRPLRSTLGAINAPTPPRGQDSDLPRKEVIQPHLPVRLPCYDFVPVISPTLGSSSLAVRSPTSGVTNSHDVTGGVYKARERIHRSMADLRLLATPASCRRVAAYNPNYEQL